MANLAAAGQAPGAIAHAGTQTQVPSRFWYTSVYRASSLRAIGKHRVCGAAMDQSNVAEDADLGVPQGEIFEGPGVSDVFEELLPVAGDNPESARRNLQRETR